MDPSSLFETERKLIFNSSEAHNISQYVLTAKADNKVARGYESIFNMSSMHSELWDFSYVHQIVLGLLHVDLKIILQNPYYQNEFDSRLDSAGRSPLYWAALIGDPVAVKLLLQAGADCTRRDHEGRTPLYGALQSGNLQCVELLLLARSSVHMKDKYGNTAIQLATLAQDDETILEAIFLAGGSVRTCNNDGVGVMSTAACLDRVRNGTYLLKIGADPEIQDNNGDMALFESLYYNNYRMLDVLLRHGVKFDKKNRFGWTVLHVAALYADLQSLDMLTSNGLKGADVEAKDDKGRTPRQAFDDRPDQLVGLREAFERLLQRVEDFNHDQLEIIEIMDDYEDHSSQSDREFFDSLETLSLDDRGNGDHIGDTPLEVY